MCQWRLHIATIIVVCFLSAAAQVQSDVFPTTECPQVPVITISSQSQTLCSNKDPLNFLKPKYLGTALIAEKPNGDLIDIPHCGNELVLSCLASKPIFWDYEGPTSAKFKSVNFTRTRTNQGHYSCFQSVAVIQTHQKSGITGRYVCSIVTGAKDDTSDSVTSDSLYLYRSRDQKAGFVFPSKKKLMRANARKKIVPCPRNDPTIHEQVNLEKQSLINNVFEYEPINPEEFNAAYDPKVGFRIKSLKPGLKIHGRYRCSVNGSWAEAVVDDKSQDAPELDSRLNLTYHEHSKCFTCHSDTEDLIPTQIQIIPCENPLECRLKLNMDYPPQYHHGGDVFDCHGHEHSNAVSKKLAQETIPTGIVICRANEPSKYQQLEYWTASELPGKPIIVNPGPSTSVQSVLSANIYEGYSEHVLYVNETFQFSCSGSNFIFSDGFQWAVKFQNGTVYQAPPGMELKLEKSNGNGYFRHGWFLNVTSDQIVEYICMAPVVTSSQWMSQSVPISVIDGQPPVILEKLSSKSQVTFYDDQENVEIKCAALGVPHPEWSWHKDNMELNDDTQNAQPVYMPDLEGHSNGTSTIILFKKAVNQGKSIEGTYYCNATNPKGTRIHEIAVRVEHRFCVIPHFWSW